MIVLLQNLVIIPLLIVCIWQFAKGHIAYMRYYRAKYPKF